MPMFSDNSSFDVASGDGNIYLVRGMIMCATGTNIQIIDHNQFYSPANVADDVASVGIETQNDGLKGKFKIIISSSAGNSYAADEGYAGIKLLTASFDPSDDAYIGKILNTDPLQFETEQYLLYAHYPVDNEIATIDTSGGNGPAIAIASGSLSDGSRKNLLNNFGSFNTRYRPAKTTKFISQPFGKREFDLFHFEAISDGAVGNDKFKISIANIRKSADPTNPYGTFTLLIRSFDDNDLAQEILEQYPNCTLDPSDNDYIAKKIGDYKIQYAFDATRDRERRLVVTGKNPNMSNRIRIVMSNEMERGEVPAEALPFGFRGVECIKTTDSLTDSLTKRLKGTYATVGSTQTADSTLGGRIGFRSGSAGLGAIDPDTSAMSGSILPPVPYRFKCTRGAIATDDGLAGNPGQLELSDSRLYWGCKFTRTPLTASITDAILNSNISSTQNEIFKNLVKFSGLSGLDVLVTGSAADEFNNNKFSLARVGLGTYLAGSVNNVTKAVETYLTGTANDHIRESVYIRNARPDAGNEYVISDGTQTQIVTLGSLASLTSSVYFNKFSEYTKFTNFLHGGFDGVNILDKDMAAMNDRATSGDAGGKASVTAPAAGNALDIGLSSDNVFGKGPDNSTVRSYRAAVDILTDPMVSRINLLAVPGIRDTAVTDFVLDEVQSYGKAMYLMDMAHFDSDNNRVFENDGRKPAVDKTINEFASRAVDSNYAATYFPGVVIDDPLNNTRVPVPASVAAIGAISYSDSISFPWFAPAGFSRGALDFVRNVGVRLKAKDRDDLYESRINPIATFPNAGFVIFGQKTLQFTKSALDRVNVRRMLLEVKRQVVEVAEALLFEPNNPETRARFISQVTPRLALVQSQQGIDQFKIVMDASNNTNEDIEQNRLNGRVVLVPTRAIEFIVMDFIITNAGVEFE